jgi:hypothetical protein
VREVIEAGDASVPALVRQEKAEPYRDQILALLSSCKGNLVRVHEELVEQGAALSYQGLTAYCRRHGIGHEPAQPTGRYHFEPGEEMQHDTSPHYAVIGGKRRAIQTAALVFCYSRMLFFQHSPRFTRFDCKVFMTDALTYFGGACKRCMIDNTHVIVLHGTGRDMVPVPEMAAFGERFGFVWQAHEKGDANRSARVERPFHYIENNFLAGREFADWEDLNRQARAFCDKVNATQKRHLHASPRELFAVEQTKLVPLPVFVPEVYALHSRIVDTEGYINVHKNRYSVPWKMIGRHVEVRETKDRIEVYDGPRRLAEHNKVLEPQDGRVTAPEHRPPRAEKVFARDATSPEERQLQGAGAEIVAYMALLKKRGRSIRVFRQLVRMLHDYPRESLLHAIRIATQYGLDDVVRLESMVLRHIAHDFFPLPHELGPTGVGGQGEKAHGEGTGETTERGALGGPQSPRLEDNHDG